MRRVGLYFALVTILLVLVSSFSVIKVSALEGIVRLRGVVHLPEYWSPACYGSYEILVTIQEVISDPEGLLEINGSISICYLTELGLGIGEYVECYGYYYYNSGPMGCVGHCDCFTHDYYYVIRALPQGDVDHDGDVDIFDVIKCVDAYGSTPSDPNWNIYCDIADPYWTVDIFDITALADHYGEQQNT